MKRYKILKYINLGLFTCLIVGIAINVFYTDKVGTAGYDLTDIESAILVEEKLNEDLTNEYLDQTSMSAVNVRALENGYIATEFEFYSLPEFASR